MITDLRDLIRAGHKLYRQAHRDWVDPEPTSWLWAINPADHDDIVTQVRHDTPVISYHGPDTAVMGLPVPRTGHPQMFGLLIIPDPSVDPSNLQLRYVQQTTIDAAPAGQRDWS